MTKNILNFVFILFFTPILYSQACGVYYLKYKGEIKSKQDLEFKIKLPNTSFFHNKSKKRDRTPRSFYYADVENRKIDLTIISNLGALYTSEELIRIYSKDRDFIPVLITATDKEGKEKRLFRKVPYTQLKFLGSNTSEKNVSITIDLGEINY